MFRKVCVAMLAMAMVFVANPASGSANVVASSGSEEGLVSPMNTLSGSQSAAIKISASGKAAVNVTASSVGNGVTKIEITTILQKYNTSTEKWGPLQKWTTTKNSFTATVEKSYQLTASGKYRTKAVITYWKGNKSETVNTYSEARTYKK